MKSILNIQARTQKIQYMPAFKKVLTARSICSRSFSLGTSHHSCRRDPYAPTLTPVFSSTFQPGKYRKATFGVYYLSVVVA